MALAAGLQPDPEAARERQRRLRRRASDHRRAGQDLRARRGERHAEGRALVARARRHRVEPRARTRRRAPAAAVRDRPGHLVERARAVPRSGHRGQPGGLLAPRGLHEHRRQPGSGDDGYYETIGTGDLTPAPSPALINDSTARSRRTRPAASTGTAPRSRARAACGRSRRGSRRPTPARSRSSTTAAAPAARASTCRSPAAASSSTTGSRARLFRHQQHQPGRREAAPCRVDVGFGAGDEQLEDLRRRPARPDLDADRCRSVRRDGPHRAGLVVERIRVLPGDDRRARRVRRAAVRRACHRALPRRHELRREHQRKLGAARRRGTAFDGGGRRPASSSSTTPRPRPRQRASP